MCESDRDEQLAVRRVVEVDDLVFAERGRRPADVEHHVADRPAGAAHELGLAGIGLEVEAAQGAAPAAGVVVLHEGDVDAERGISVLPVGLDEEAALVPVHVGLDEDEPREPRREGPHQRATSSRK